MPVHPEGNVHGGFTGVYFNNNTIQHVLSTSCARSQDVAFFVPKGYNRGHCPKIQRTRNYMALSKSYKTFQLTGSLFNEAPTRGLPKL